MISLIVAKASNDIIGGDNKLLWHISEDLKRFKEITSNSTIIMGRKTFESLPKILPNRFHVILTRDNNFKVDSDAVKVSFDINEIISLYKDTKEEVFVIGGGEIYNLFMPYADKLYLTEVYKDFEGDTKFPKVNLDEWTTIFESEKFTNESNGLEYKFIDLVRK